MINLSGRRIFSILSKEVIKLTRAPTAIILIIIFPFLQIALLGYALNVSPKHLPTAVMNYDQSPLTRRLVQAISTTSYFNINYFPKSEAEANNLMLNNKVNFILTIPSGFTHDLIRGNQPHLLIQTDGSIPGSVGNATQALISLVPIVFERQFFGVLNYLAPSPNPFVIDNITNYNASLDATHAIVPGLIGLILTLSLTSLAASTITEEKEAGTMETLLNTPIRPLEILIGKFISYLVVGYIQLICIVYLSTNILFNVPMVGSVFTLLIASLPFLAGNLMLGIAASSIATKEMEANQYVTFFVLPSVLLSGFAFPFFGMPKWAQMVGNILPLTHYIHITTGIMLKGYTWKNILPELWPILLFFIAALYIGLFTSRKTLG